MTKRNVKIKIQLCHGYSIPGTQRIMKRPRLLSRGRFVVFIDNLPYLKTILSTVLAYYYWSGFWVWVFNIDWILQFFYITKQIINSLNYLFILWKNKLFVTRRQQTICFYMTLQNKNETVALNAKDKISRGLNSNELSRTDNISNNASNVNNNERM